MYGRREEKLMTPNKLMIPNMADTSMVVNGTGSQNGSEGKKTNKQGET